MAKKAKAAKKTATRKPKAQDLPGMEDRAIAALEDAAHSYAEVRDERMALNKREGELKADLLKLMKSHGKETYKRDGIEIRIVHEEETVKVRIKTADDVEQA